jgi:hypothetical protein
MSTARTAERLAKIDRLIDYLARQRGEFPDPERELGIANRVRYLEVSAAIASDLSVLTKEKEQARIALAAYDRPEQRDRRKGAW